MHYIVNSKLMLLIFLEYMLFFIHLQKTMQQWGGPICDLLLAVSQPVNAPQQEVHADIIEEEPYRQVFFYHAEIN